MKAAIGQTSCHMTLVVKYDVKMQIQFAYSSCISLGISTPKPGVSVTPSAGNLNARKCTFEQTNICGYTQDKTDNFDWRRDNQGTATSSTGPSKDHTYGTTGGMYYKLSITQSYDLLTHFYLKKGH